MLNHAIFFFIKNANMIFLFCGETRPYANLNTDIFFYIKLKSFFFVFKTTLFNTGKTPCI